MAECEEYVKRLRQNPLALPKAGLPQCPAGCMILACNINYLNLYINVNLIFTVIN